jgi:hypothetical protein
MDPHRLAEERSLAYHVAVMQKVSRDPAVIERARATVRRWLSEGRALHYARAWDRLLSGPPADLCELLVADTDEARALRQATPFAGVIEPRERWRIWRHVRQTAERR